MLLTIILLAASVLVLRFIFSEIHLHRTGGSPLGLRRLRLRIIAGILLIGLFLAIIVGVVILKLTAPDHRPMFFLTYWLACLAAALGLMLLAMIDMLQVSRLQRHHDRDHWKDLSNIFPPTERDKKNKS